MASRTVAQAGGPPLKRHLFEAAMAVLTLLAAVVCLLAGAGFGLASLYMFLTPALGGASSALLCALAAGVVGLLLAMWARVKAS